MLTKPTSSPRTDAQMYSLMSSSASDRRRAAFSGYWWSSVA